MQKLFHYWSRRETVIRTVKVAAIVAPLLLYTDLAARTKHIKFASLGLVLPTWDPIRVAEAILLSDRIALVTNGPARLTKSLDVTIARPRSRETIIDMPENIQLRNRVLHFLLQASDRRDLAATAAVPFPSASLRPEPSVVS